MSARARRILLFAVAGPLLLLGLLEGITRVAWANQYALDLRRAPVSLGAVSRPTRFHPARLDMRMDADGIYEGGGALRFRTTTERAVRGTAQDRAGRVWLAVGGSTTECALVPEGARWPDLLPGPAWNFGVSGNTCHHSLRNLLALAPRFAADLAGVYLMQAYNDVLAFTKTGGELDLRSYEGGDLDLYVGERPPAWQSWSRLACYLRYAAVEARGRKYLGHYRHLQAIQAELPDLEAAEFDRVRKLMESKLLPQRRAALLAIAGGLRDVGARFVLLTQPHAYRQAKWTGPDLRTRLVWKGRRLTHAQCASLLDRVNEHTRAVAKACRARLVDLAAAIEPDGAEALFYDQVHYTPAGSRRVAAELGR